MAYIRRISYAGNIVLVEKYHSYRYGRKHIARRHNENKTRITQSEINKRNAARNRMLTACENFEPGSYFIRLSYLKGNRPANIDVAHDNLRVVTKKIKRKDKNFKYMGVTERGSKGGLHHHLLVPKDFDIQLLIELWDGAVEIRKTFTGELSQVAAYMTKGECDYMFDKAPKQKAVEKKYIASRNLRKPIVKKEIIKKSSHWTSYPGSMKLNGVMYDIKKGSEYNGSTADGYEYQRYIMVRRN